MAVFWGIMLAWIIPTLLCIALVVLVVIGGIGAATVTTAERSHHHNITAIVSGHCLARVFKPSGGLMIGKRFFESGRLGL